MRAGALGRLAGAAVVAGAILLTAGRRLRAQDVAVRFDLVTVGDSTVSFRLGRQGWVRPGMKAAVVDPRRRDLLVARLRVQLVTRDSAVALVTGQTMPVVRDHLVLIDRPPTRFFRSTGFWGGIVAGLASGFVIGKL